MSERLKRIRREIVGVASVFAGIYFALSLATYSEWDSSPFVFTTLPARNYGGIIGSYAADFLISAIGLSAFALPVVFCVYGVRRLLGRENHWTCLVGLILFVLSTSILASLITATFHMELIHKSGGLAGYLLGELLVSLLSLPGAYIVTLTLFLSSLIILSPVSLVSFMVGEKGKEPEEAFPPSAEGPIILGEPSPVFDVPKADPVPEEGPSTGHEREGVPERRSFAGAGDAGLLPGEGPVRRGQYELPGIGLLHSPAAVSARPAREEILTSSALLERKLKDFDVEGKVIQVHSGPVVTMYEFEPAPGVKINRVVSLSDDLALSLKAQSVRVSTLQGKAAIGIEVPNRVRETVCLKEIVASDIFQKSYSKLTLALGKDIFGNPIVADLTKMPHLLVAGATGAGKSVSINSMVMSILYKSAPSEVKMLMIDPKLLELSAYENISHLISPVITGAKEAAEALRKMVFEMERRYRLLAEKGVRNIEAFNRMVSDGERLPYLVVFIDELADLMFASANEVEDSIARLAQMARASGIHLILATQRPSVDVITGVIKANFPARISFQVTSRIDSRTIIDSQGAEQLLGKGDMLMMLPGMRITRVHGALVTEEEIRAVTKFIMTQGRPDYSLFEAIAIEDPDREDISAEKDDMYGKVLEFGESMGEVSISSIQRRFKIGYNRAARMMELLEEDGLVGPPKGAGKPRDFLRKRR
ncbi:MAG: DNA translocase FtsK 4TM domain-containing protein [Nitrospirae bacterium]|nr:DNA translocase FtsK 4TM domain-containing protein [Nitrospirota bacterium]